MISILYPVSLRMVCSVLPFIILSHYCVSSALFLYQLFGKPVFQDYAMYGSIESSEFRFGSLKSEFYIMQAAIPATMAANPLKAVRREDAPPVEGVMPEEGEGPEVLPLPLPVGIVEPPVGATVTVPLPPPYEPVGALLLPVAVDKVVWEAVAEFAG